MASGFQSRQHKRRLVDEWPFEAAYRQVWEVVAAGLRAMDAEMRAIRESERRETMVGGTGGPPPDPWADADGGNGGMRTETCSVCDGAGEYEYSNGRMQWPVRCDACGGVGKITYRSAKERQTAAENAALLAQHDSTLELVKRQRAAAVARDVASLPPHAAAHIQGMRTFYAAGTKWHGREDR